MSPFIFFVQNLQRPSLIHAMIITLLMNPGETYGKAHISGYDDTLVEWSGWYRLYLNGESAQMSEWCVSYVKCGGDSGLYLNGSHPTLEDGVVTREVVGTSLWYSSECGDHKSTSVQVKACLGDYYVYEFVKPNISIPRPTYCAGAVLGYSFTKYIFVDQNLAVNTIC